MNKTYNDFIPSLFQNLTQIHIGDGVYLKETDHLAVEGCIGKPLEAVKKLAMCVFGRHHLATHNRTGLKSNAHLHLEAKGKLDENKLSVITSTIIFYSTLQLIIY